MKNKWSILIVGMWCNLSALAEPLQLGWQFAEDYLRGAVEAERDVGLADALWRQEVNAAYLSLQRNFQDVDMISRLAKYLFLSGRFDDAAETAWAGLRQDGDREDLLFMLAAALIFERDYTQAERLLQAMLEESESMSIRLLQAWSLYRQGEYQSALDHLQGLEVEEVAAWAVDLNKAECLMSLNRTEEAQTFFDRYPKEVAALVGIRISKKEQDPGGNWIEQSLEEVEIPSFLKKAEDRLHRSSRNPESSPMRIQVVDEPPPEETVELP